ncbi:MAG: tetratricopeptide repeat protein [Bacteroidota bacterium]
MKLKKFQGQEQVPRHIFKPNGWFAIISAIVGLLLYSNTITHNYVLDDRIAILENKYVMDGISGIPKILTIDFWHFQNANLGYYRPLSLITFAIENQFFPEKPQVSHLGNVILYALTGFFLCLLLMSIFKHVHPVFSFVVTLLFIAHPIHTEVVANIKSRDEILSFLNLIIAFFILLKAYKTKATNYKLLFISCIFFYLALLSKETALAGLFVIPLILFFSFDLTLKQSLTRSIPFLALFLIFQFQKYLALGSISGHVPNDIVNYPYMLAGQKFSSSILIFLHYLRLTIFPHPLSYDYAYNQIPATKFNFLILIGFLLVIALIYIILRGIKKKSSPAFGGFFFLITLSPALIFVLARGGILAERFLYAPVLGFCIIITWVIYFKFGDLKFDRFKSYFIPLLSIACIFFLYSFKTVTRNTVWSNNISLFSTDVNTSPNSCQVHRHYGSELIDIGIREKDEKKKDELFYKGIGHLKIALDIHPHLGDAFLHLGYAYQHIKENYDSAIYYYNRCIEDAPGQVSAYNNLGVVYEKLGRQELASYYFNKSVEVNPNFSIGIRNRDDHKKRTGIDIRTFPSQLDPEIIEKMAKNKDALFYFKLGTLIIQKDTTQLTKAIKYLKKAIEMDPKMEDAYLNLASCYGMTKKYVDAIEILNKELKINPKNKYAYILLGVSYEKMGDKEKAEECNEMVKKLSYP